MEERDIIRAIMRVTWYLGSFYERKTRRNSVWAFGLFYEGNDLRLRVEHYRKGRPTGWRGKEVQPGFLRVKYLGRVVFDLSRNRNFYVGGEWERRLQELEEQT